MKVEEFAELINGKIKSISGSQNEITSGFTCDLLSWVMGRASQDNAWITIMSNRNIVAVATLADTACIVLAEGVAPDEGVAQLATDKGVNILQSPHSAYEIALSLRDAL